MPEDSAGRAGSKWGGIRCFAQMFAFKLVGEMSVDEVEAELRRRVEPLLEAADKVEQEIIWLGLQAFPNRTQQEVIQHSPVINELREVLATWRNK